MGKTWSHRERSDKQHKKSFLKLKQERKSKHHHYEPITKKKDDEGNR